ncbi:MAG: thioredoxin family protein [Colwellia sp.]|nr:thioredoxin family protein [Colwellia sp.]
MKTYLIKLFSLATLSLLALFANANDNDNEDFAFGMISAESLLTDYAEFNNNFQDFTLSAEEQNVIADWPKNLTIDVYFGTWCHDSLREVPKLLKILSGNKDINLSLIGLDHQKQDPKDLATTNKVKYTPTIIVYRDADKKQEIGRIIERPKQSLIIDINQFL